jgi:glyceraldehyde 3-phosphate dehydrogenase
VTTRVAINGFGRIGRLYLRASLSHPDIEVVAINDLTPPRRTPTSQVRLDPGPPGRPGLLDERRHHRGRRDLQGAGRARPAELPWKELDVDVVIESTGPLHHARRARPSTSAAGARKVIISAPRPTSTRPS